MSLDHLAAELVYQVLDGIGDEDLRATTCIALSLTCKRLKEVLRPQLFKTVRFSNDKRISDSALIAATRNGSYIQKLEFVGFDPADEEALPEIRKDRNHTLPPSALTLFEASRALLPNLQTFVISFDHSFDEIFQGYSGHKNMNGLAFFDSIETDKRTTSREEVLSPRRELWANTYRFLASNTTVSHLVIHNWPPRAITVFWTEAWTTYLGRLHSFEISIAGYQERSARGEVSQCSNTLPGYQREVEKMGEYFFDHLTSAKTVKISGSERFPVGLFTGSFDMPRISPCNPRFFTLPLKPSSMPAVEYLTLSNFFISHDLVLWIAKHKHTLRTLVLTRALCLSRLCEVPNCIHVCRWMEFFDALSAVEGLALAHFEVTTHCPFGRGRANTPNPASAYVISEDGQYAYAITDPLKEKVKLFGHAWLRPDRGSVGYLPGPNFLRFSKGEDLAAFKRFMSKLEVAGNNQ